jgi:two-component system NtrC family sensor kinase
VKAYLATIPAESLRQKPREAYYAGQKRLFVLVVIAVAVLPLVAINWKTSSFYQKSWLAKTSGELSGFADSRRELIDRFLIDQENLLGAFTELYDQQYLSRPGNLAKVFQAINKSGVITDLGVIDGNGQHLAYVGPFADKLAGRNYAAAPWFGEVMRQGRYVSDVFTGYRQVPHLVIAVAAPDRSWVLRATVNSAMFNGLVSSANVGPGGDAYIISAGGELQTPGRLGNGQAAPEDLKLLRGAAADGNHARQQGRYLYAVTPLNGGAWWLVLKTDIASSLQEFYQARKIGLAVIVAAALAILGVAQQLIRSLVNRIEKAEQQRMTLTGKVREVEKMALIGRMAASVAHEINNPLQVIGAQAGWVEELLEEGPEHQSANHQEQLEAVGKIRHQVRRAAAITRRLLGFSRHQEGPWQGVDLNQTVEETILLLEKEAKSLRIDIRRDYQSDLEPVVTDGSQLQQVFLNLLNNGVDAVERDGVITVTTVRDSDSVRVCFADSGPGIAPDHLEKIFDPFFTTKAKGKGTGLGLAVSRDIMRRLQGELRAGNGLEGGGLFTVTLGQPGPPELAPARNEHNRGSP